MKKNEERHIIDIEDSYRRGKVAGKAAGRDEGKAEGIAEGLATGLATGRAEGLAAGRAEGKAEGRAEERAETARRMLDLGQSAEFVSQCTGLTVGEIEKLRCGKYGGDTSVRNVR